jgi:hypothetical protein
MLTDLEPAAPTTRHWSWKKITLGIITLLTLLLLFLLSYDQELQPYDDLKPEPVTVAPEQNGYIYLKERWEKFPPLSKAERDDISQTLQGNKPWDPALLEQVRKGRETARDDLEAASRLPDFVVPPAAVSAMFEETHTWLLHPYSYLRLELEGAVLAGENARALESLSLLRKSTQRHLESRGNLIQFLVGLSVYSASILSASDLLDRVPLDEEQLSKLAGEWSSDPQLIPSWHAAMKWEAAGSRVMIGRVKSNDPAVALKTDFLHRILIKENQTANQIHRNIRHLMEAFSHPWPTLDAAKAAGYTVEETPAGWAGFLDPNAMGNSLAKGSTQILSIIPGIKTKAQFLPRALRVKIALLRWRLKHPGQWPATLTELVPAYLPAVPEDPWNGQPLLWDQASRTIYAVGSDWKPDLPVRKPGKRSSVLTDEHKSPSLLVEPTP